MKTKCFLAFLITCSLMIFFDSCELFRDGKSNDECNSNRNVVYKNGELLVNGSALWFMSVANLNGSVPVADRNCHTQMTLKFWFKNNELAKTNTKPPISIVFTGGGGFFDPGKVATYVTLKMLDSTYYWTAYCDQAAKNAPDNPTDFGISVTWDYNQMLSLEDVELSGIIDYKVYQKP